MRVLVIGAGIVGLACAWSLRRDGHDVVVLDRDPEGDKASYGNAGGVAVTEIVPAAVPGIAWRVPGWLLDPLGPLSLRLRHAPAMTPWLLRFLRSGRPAEVERIAAALAALNARAADDLRAVMADAGAGDLLVRAGALSVYESEDGFRRDGPAWALRRRHGIACDVLDGEAARALEPALGPVVRRAVHTPQWEQVADPRALVGRLRERLVAMGCTIRRAEALALWPGGRVRLADGGTCDADKVVVAAGAWSGRLASSLGDRALLESERGYNVTIPEPGVAVTREIIFAERAFVAAPLRVGLRIGGAAEFAGLDAPANHARSRALATLARRYLPGLSSGAGTSWMGNRPTTPDSLPVIGPSPRHPEVLYAFGHGHLGLTQAATTGRLIAASVAGEPPPVDLAPYAIARFALRRGRAA